MKTKAFSKRIMQAELRHYMPPVMQIVELRTHSGLLQASLPGYGDATELAPEYLLDEIYTSFEEEN